MTMTTTLLSLPRLYAYAAGAKRSYSLLAATRLSEILSNNNQTHVRQCSSSIINNNFTAAQHQSITATKPYNSLLQLQQQQQQRRIIQRNFSKYVSVDHSSAYTDAINSSHGQQLQLALEEGRGKDDAPFDPFSAFLDEMGQTDDDVNKIDSNDDDNIEEAEFEEHDKQDKDDDLDDHYDEDYDEFDNDDADDDDAQPMYDVTGAPLRPKSERLALRAGYPSGGTFAVIYLAGFQHKVTKDDLLVVNKLKPVSEWSVGSTHTIKGDDVLLVANQHKTCVGLPGVAGAEVDVMVEEITRDKTMIIFKKRRRKHSRRKNGFRRQVTFLRVLDVRMPQGEVDVDGLESESMAA
jgi:large subunit ribosomal protein L21